MPYINVKSTREGATAAQHAGDFFGFTDCPAACSGGYGEGPARRPRAPWPRGPVLPEAAGPSAPSGGSCSGSREPGLGLRRLRGDLNALGIRIAATTVRETIKDAASIPRPNTARAGADLLPGNRRGTSWAADGASQGPRGCGSGRTRAVA
ncbi:hypothetical protein ACU686_09580 [Yinghuangia aomiensis]